MKETREIMSALDAAELGYRVHPVGGGVHRKAPLWPDWENRSTDNLVEVAKFNDRPYGINPGPDCVVLDFDTKACTEKMTDDRSLGAAVKDTVKVIATETGNDPESVETELKALLRRKNHTLTPTGGLHLPVRVPEGLRLRSRRNIAPGVHLKTGGWLDEDGRLQDCGQVVGPGSDLGGGRYTGTLCHRNELPVIGPIFLKWIARHAGVAHWKANDASSGNPGSAGHRPLELEIGAQPVPDQARQILDALVAANRSQPRLFTNGGRIARLGEDPETGGKRIEVLDDMKLSHELNLCVQFVSTAKGGKKRYRDAPAGIVKHIMGSPLYPFPKLRSIQSTPFFAPDGKLISEPGYHGSSGTYLSLQDGFRLPQPVPTNPSKEDLENARHLVEDPLLDFPFEDAASRMNCIGLNLLPFCRPMIDGPTPIHLIGKAAPGTGAGLLADVHSLIAYGYAAPIKSESKAADEVRKAITAHLISGAQLFFLDNLHGTVSDPALAAALTGRIWTDRILSKSKDVEIPIRTIWLIAANNPSLSPELARRTTVIWLVVRAEDPTVGRKFKYMDLHDHVRRCRASYVWAYLTLIQNWISTGRPKFSGTPLASFEDWSRTIGGILERAYPDDGKQFLSNRSRIEASMKTEEDQAMKAFVTKWWEWSQDDWVMIGTAEASLATLGDKPYDPTPGSLCDLYDENRSTVDLGFNGRPPSTWPTELKKVLRRHNERVFDIKTSSSLGRINVQLRKKPGSSFEYSLEKLPA